MSSWCSEALSVDASPVVPQTTSAVAPCSIWPWQSRSNARRSSAPSWSNGVGSAGAYPDRRETWRPSGYMTKSSGREHLLLDVEPARRNGKAVLAPRARLDPETQLLQDGGKLPAVGVLAVMDP